MTFQSQICKLPLYISIPLRVSLRRTCFIIKVYKPYKHTRCCTWTDALCLWQKQRNGMFVHDKMQRSSYNKSNSKFDMHQITNAKINFWFSRFILEVQKKNSEEHPPNKLYQMICRLQMYIKETKLSSLILNWALSIEH